VAKVRARADCLPGPGWLVVSGDVSLLISGVATAAGSADLVVGDLVG
jgi:hypothetical protein